MNTRLVSRGTLRGFAAASLSLALGVTSGCAGSSGGSEPSPVVDAAVEGDSDREPSSAVVADASSTPTTPPRLMDAGPDGSGGPDKGMSAKSCASEQDCTGACPMGTTGCTCAQGPMGKVCVPTCTADKDCPTAPNGVALTCSAEKTCTPPKDAGH